MSQFILRQKKVVTIVTGFLVFSGLLAHFVFHQEGVYEWSFILSSLIGVVPIALQAFQSLRVKVISIDVLVTIAVVAAFWIGSYDESAIVTFLFLLGAFIEQYTLGQTRSAIKRLTAMAPETALLKMENGQFQEVDVDEVEIGQELLVKTGAKVPVDGQVIEGSGLVDESAITGESERSRKTVGSSVFAGTIVDSGVLSIRSEKVGEDTTFGKIIELVEEAQDSKSQVERYIDRFSTYYTPFILLLAILVWFVTKDIRLAITILVLGCPGALVIGVPVSNVAGIGNGAKNGVLLKGSEVIQRFSKVDTMVFDKTGTLTVGQPSVVEKKFYGNADETAQALRYLANLERTSDHPLAMAILSAIGQQDNELLDEVEVIKGGGLKAKHVGKIIHLGNANFLKKEQVDWSKQMEEDVYLMEKNGNSIVLLAIDGKVLLLFGIRDAIRPEVKANLQALKTLGIKRFVLLSGDNQGTVDTVAKELDLTEAHGQMLPEEKSSYIQELKEEGAVVAFVGDGINDSPSIALADIGIAMGSGTDVAIETSDVVLVQSHFDRLPFALGLAKKTALNMIENIVIAIAVVAFLLFNLIVSDWINMSIGMFVHEASILVVIINGMRLLHYSLTS